MDSTKRIKKELWRKRSDFLGIEGGTDDSYLEPGIDTVSVIITHSPSQPVVLTSNRSVSHIWNVQKSNEIKLS